MSDDFNNNNNYNNNVFNTPNQQGNFDNGIKKKKHTKIIIISIVLGVLFLVSAVAGAFFISSLVTKPIGKKLVEDLKTNTTAESTVKISEDLLKTNDTLKLKNLVIPINSQWEQNAEETDENSYSYYVSKDDLFLYVQISVEDGPSTEEGIIAGIKEAHNDKDLTYKSVDLFDDSCSVDYYIFNDEDDFFFRSLMLSDDCDLYSISVSSNIDNQEIADNLYLSITKNLEKYKCDTNEEEETTAPTEPYVKTNTKYLYNNLDYYYCDPVTTTIKINYYEDEDYCAYVVKNTSKYKNFTVAFDFLGSDYDCNAFKKGDYITVSGYADATSYDKGTIVIEVDKIEPTDKSLFNSIKSKTTKPKSLTDGKTLIYSDDNVNIYFDDVEVDDYFDEFNVHYIVKNKSNIEYEFQGDTLTLDGVSYNDITMSDPVAPKSTGRIEANIDGKPNTTNPKTVGIGFVYFDDNYDNIKNINASSVKIK